MNRRVVKIGGLWPALVLVMALAGCASTPSTPVHVVSEQPHLTYSPTRYVSVLYNKPTRPYRVLATLRVQGQAGTSVEQLIGALSEKARSLGANAIIVNDESAEQGPDVKFNPTGGNYEFSSGSQVPRLRAEAVRWVKQESK